MMADMLQLVVSLKGAFRVNDVLGHIGLESSIGFRELFLSYDADKLKHIGHKLWKH
jgi:hypothetical protein